LAVANATDNNVSILRGFGNGTFAAPVAFDVDANPQSLTIGDFNADGKQDIAASNLSENSLSVLLNTSTPTPNNDPVITSNGGEDTAAVSIAENSTAVTTVVASDPDAGQTLSYSLADGADGNLFTINATTGAIAFINAPDYENPTDAGANNVYDVTVQVSDGSGGFDTQAIAVTVQNVAGSTITGTIRADTLIGTGEEDFLYGRAGNDSLQGLAGNDYLDGEAGQDRMAGGAGNDTYVVDNSADVVIENSGNGTDTVLSSISLTLGANVENLTLTGTFGGSGTGNALGNNIIGNGADNTLSGLAGNDVLDGGGGNDKLIGGLGADILTGGAGADNFVFSAVVDSTPAAFDIVQDFVHGTDKIDIAGIDANASTKGDQAFAFAGQNSGAVAKSVTWYESDGNTFVQADVNGNTTADFLIRLTGTNLNLSASDFLL
jgi:Ca2+-binding RTX toxin-like protein